MLNTNEPPLDLSRTEYCCVLNNTLDNLGYVQDGTEPYTTAAT
jgi:hypothetical protein